MTAGCDLCRLIAGFDAASASAGAGASSAAANAFAGAAASSAASTGSGAQAALNAATPPGSPAAVAAPGLQDALVWRDDRLVVIFVDEAGYPGYTRVVWHDHVREMTDLSPQGRDHVMQTVWAVEQAQRDTMSPHKVNVASFGNMTPHVHWHVIPRYTDDAHFPNPTWGAKQREPDAAAVAARQALLPQLRAAIVAKLNKDA